MLNLVPLRELPSVQEVVQEVLQEQFVDKLIRQIKRKYHFAESTMTQLSVRLHQLALPDLEALFEAIFDLPNLHALNDWINARLPVPGLPQAEEKANH